MQSTRSTLLLLSFGPPLEVVDLLGNVIEKESETAKITTRANPTATDILGLDETVLNNPRGNFFIKSQFLFVSVMMDFSKN